MLQLWLFFQITRSIKSYIMNKVYLRYGREITIVIRKLDKSTKRSLQFHFSFNVIGYVLSSGIHKEILMIIVVACSICKNHSPKTTVTL